MCREANRARGAAECSIRPSRHIPSSLYPVVYELSGYFNWFSVRLRENRYSMHKETVSVVSSTLLTDSVEGWDRPGFSLRMDEWLTEDQPSKKRKCLSLTRHSSPLWDSTNETRFAEPVDASVLQEAAKGVVPLKTEQSTQWAVKNFGCWARSRSSSSSEVVPPDLLRSHDGELVCKWLCSFVLETRKTDGSRYPPATVQSLVSGLNRELQ